MLRKISFTLWHKHLDHIYWEGDEKLIRINILPFLKFDDLDTYVDCIRSKFIKTNIMGTTNRSQPLVINYLLHSLAP
jgi:hypothetical protein